MVGTPGRLIDLANQGLLDLGHVRTLVLDEADEMLDLGFLPDVERIVRQVPQGRQTMLFSATMPGQIVTLARRVHAPPHPHPRRGPRRRRPDGQGRRAARLPGARDGQGGDARPHPAGRGPWPDTGVLPHQADRRKVADDLADRGFASGAVHGDLGQGAREQALRAFRSGKVDVLVATDVAARGIDVDDITHVINYQCPDDEKTYLHRIGRTARAGKSGVAITFVDWDEAGRWMMIDKALDLGFGEPEETYSSSDHLYEELDIPRDVTGVLPRAKRTRAGLDAEKVEDLGETGKHAGGRSAGAVAREGAAAAGVTPGVTPAAAAGTPAAAAAAAGARTATAAPGTATGAATRVPRKSRRGPSAPHPLASDGVRAVPVRQRRAPRRAPVGRPTRARLPAPPRRPVARPVGQRGRRGHQTAAAPRRTRPRQAPHRIAPRSFKVDHAQHASCASSPQRPEYRSRSCTTDTRRVHRRRPSQQGLADGSDRAALCRLVHDRLRLGGSNLRECAVSGKCMIDF